MASLKSIILEKIIISLDKKGDITSSFLARLKRKTAKKYRHQFVTNSELIKAYHKLIENKTIAPNAEIEDLLRRRQIRTLSGVAVVTVLTCPYSCPGQCIFCPKELGMPKSYLKNEPAAHRAFLTKFYPSAQVAVRLKALANNSHPIDKIELIILGGTWSAYPEGYQHWFIKECFKAVNKFTTKSERPIGLQKNTAFRITAPKKFILSKIKKALKSEQRKNETAKHRIIGLTLETRPDYIDLKEIDRMRDLGCTRVELGAQSVYDDVLQKNQRGHSVAQTIAATKLLKNAGFKINYHVMLNLPGSNLLRDRQMFVELFSNPDFQPDLLKIYPCAVLKTAKLYDLWRAKKYRPYTEKQLVALLLAIKKNIPPYVRIQRIIRDIPADDIVAGSKTSNLRQLIDNLELKECQCIRCREIRGQYSAKDKIKFFRRNYFASGGQEIFLSFESQDRKKIYALLRLRINSPSLPNKSRGRFENTEILPVLQDAALIRELHTYGRLVNIGQRSDKKTQHIGLGKRLMLEAEKIIRNETVLKKIAVISGVGVREYYKKLGYRLKDEYMVKSL
jgi:elongator complex protein 3